MVDFFTINIHYGNMLSYLPSAFCYRNKTDELRARSTRFTPPRTIERFLKRGVKLHCDDLDKNGTEELKRDIMYFTPPKSSQFLGEFSLHLPVILGIHYMSLD